MGLLQCYSFVGFPLNTMATKGYIIVFLAIIIVVINIVVSNVFGFLTIVSGILVYWYLALQ